MGKPDLPPGPPVHQIRPMLLDNRKHAAFSSPDWSYEIKYDGWRMLAEFGAGRVDLRTRRGVDATGWFPEVAEALAAYRGGPHVVDGEMCVLDDRGRSDFHRFQERAARRSWYRGCDPVVFCLFDLLVESGRSVMRLSLEERKARLGRLFTPRPTKTVLVVSAIPETGEELFRLAVDLDLEGLVAKRHGSIYVPGSRTEDWRKIRRAGAVPPKRFRR